MFKKEEEVCVTKMTLWHPYFWLGFIAYQPIVGYLMPNS